MKRWRLNQRFASIICDTCKEPIGLDDAQQSVSKEYAGAKPGEHECYYCKRNREDSEELELMVVNA